MANKNTDDEQVELLRTLLIVQLVLASVPQHNIREIAGCNMNRVNAIARLVGKPIKEEKESENG